MYVGNGAVISDSYFPFNEDTGLSDSMGETLHTRDIVRIRGCTARYGVIGRSYDPKVSYSVYFGGKHGSVEWVLTPDILNKLTKMNSIPTDWE